MAWARALPDDDALAALRDATGLTGILVRTDGYGRRRRIDCDVLELLIAGTLPDCDRSVDVHDPNRLAWIRLADRGGDAWLRLVARDDRHLLFEVATKQLSYVARRFP
jgi:hypothetical protein